MLRLRRWCSATSTRWCETRVRIDGRKGGLIESEAFWININRDTLMQLGGPRSRADRTSP
jgi:acyl-ACP thioesterase